jgi:hypothetical protein
MDFLLSRATFDGGDVRISKMDGCQSPAFAFPPTSPDGSRERRTLGSAAAVKPGTKFADPPRVLLPHGSFTVKIREIGDPTQRPPNFVAFESSVARPQGRLRSREW